MRHFNDIAFEIFIVENAFKNIVYKCWPYCLSLSVLKCLSRLHMWIETPYHVPVDIQGTYGIKLSKGTYLVQVCCLLFVKMCY